MNEVEQAKQSNSKPEPNETPKSESDHEMIEEIFPSVEVLQKENEELKTQCAEYLDSLQRERANFTNYKRRIDQENATIYDRSLVETVKIFLPVVDDLERALKNKPAESTDGQWINGIELILQKLQQSLKSKGIVPLVVEPGDLFDPRFHEAISHEENEQFSDGQVIEAVQPGYKLKDIIIRPALVRVAK